MEIPCGITKFLQKNKVYYQVVVHPPAFTSSETAHAGHISGKQLAKAVMVKADGKDRMVVLPAHRTVDFIKLGLALNAKDIYVEEEEEFKNLFLDCETGAMPPLGPLYNIPCCVDQSLRESNTMYFCAGNHEECIEIATEDFFRVVKGPTGDFSVEGKKLGKKVGVVLLTPGEPFGDLSPSRTFEYSKPFYSIFEHCRQQYIFGERPEDLAEVETIDQKVWKKHQTYLVRLENYPLKKAAYYRRLQVSTGIKSVRGLAEITGEDWSFIAKVLKTLELPASIREFLANHPDPEIVKHFHLRTLLELARLENERAQLARFREIIEGL